MIRLRRQLLIPGARRLRGEETRRSPSPAARWGARRQQRPVGSGRAVCCWQREEGGEKSLPGFLSSLVTSASTEKAPPRLAFDLKYQIRFLPATPSTLLSSAPSRRGLGAQREHPLADFPKTNQARYGSRLLAHQVGASPLAWCHCAFTSRRGEGARAEAVLAGLLEHLFLVPLWSPHRGERDPWCPTRGLADFG